jgi:hypothetical protein
VPAEAPEEKKSRYKLSADIVSSYIWRGTVGSTAPNIQPTLAFTAAGFEAGVWGSTDFTGSYKEIDPYVSYTLKFIKFTVTDYYWIWDETSYFNYKNSETNHILEGSVGFALPEGPPLSISINTMFYGADKKWDKDTGSFSSQQNYSTYIEMNYTVGPATFILGMTPFNGYYGAGYGKVDGFAICNVGVSAVRDIKITPSFSMPLRGSLIVNPQSESIYFVVGITL